MLILRTLTVLLLLLPVLPAASQQTPKGFAACNANTIAATNPSSNVQLKNCGPSVILMNITSQEAFFNVGQTAAAVAAATNYSLPGNSFLMITVPDETAAGWFVAGFTSTGSTTIPILEGRAQ
jgi:hypothetical protein